MEPLACGGAATTRDAGICGRWLTAASVVLTATLAVTAVYATLMVRVIAAMVCTKFWQSTRTHIERISDTRTLLYYKRCIWI